MCKHFLKLNLDNDEAIFLARNHPNAFILLTLIAMRARRLNGQVDGLIIGDALIGSSDLEPGMSRQNFRTALKKLTDFGYVEIVHNSKNFIKRQKSTIKITIKSTLVNLLNSKIYDINSKHPNQPANQQLTNDQPTANHKQEGRRKKKSVKKDHPSTPSKQNERMMDDFSFENKIEICPGVFLTQVDLDACIKIKGNIESVRTAVAFIQGSPRRKKEIQDWPNALTKWKIGNSAMDRIEKNIAIAEKISKEFANFNNGNGWRCYIYTDRRKDVKVLLFEYLTGYKEPISIALIDPEFEKKCINIIKTNNMRKNENV